MITETSTAEVIGNIIGGLLFYSLMLLIIYYVTRLAIRHERTKHKLEVENELKGMKLNVRNKR